MREKIFDTFDWSNAFAFRVQVTHTLTRKNKMSNLIGLTFSTTMLLNWVLFYQDASRKDGFWAHRWFWTSPHRRYIGKAPWSRPGQTWAWSCPPPSTRSSSPPANTWSPATGHRVRHNQGVSQCLMWCQGDCKRVVWYIFLKIPAGLLYYNNQYVFTTWQSAYPNFEFRLN